MHAQLYMAVLVVMVLLYIFKSVVIQIFFRYLLKFVCCDFFRKQAHALNETDKKRENFSEDILFELEISNLSELYKRSIRDLTDYEGMIA